MKTIHNKGAFTLNIEEHLEFKQPVHVKRFQLPPLKKSLLFSPKPARFPALTRQQQSLMVSIIILLLITSALTGLVDIFTFRLNVGGHISGNGNPGLLVIFVLIPLYIVLLVLTGMASVYYFFEKMRDGRYSGGIIIFLLVTAGIFALLAYLFYIQIFKDLGGGPDHVDSAIYRFGEWNQYTNTGYINILTYSLGLVCSVIVGYVVALFIRRKGSISGK